MDLDYKTPEDDKLNWGLVTKRKVQQVSNTDF